MANLKNLTKKMYQVTLSGTGAEVKAFWQGCTAPEQTFEDTKVTNPEKGILEHISGFVEYGNVTLKKLYEPAVDQAIFTFVQTYREKREPFTVTIQPIRADAAGSPIPSSKAIVLSGCTVVKYKMPEADRESTDASMVELEVTVGEAQYQ
jgi:hypothetical protein